MRRGAAATASRSRSGFSYEIGGLFEPMCGIKRYALSTWSRCWTKENTRSAPYFAEIAESIGDGIEAGIVPAVPRTRTRRASAA